MPLDRSTHGRRFVGIERHRELRRLRRRRKKVSIIKRRAKSASPSEKPVLAAKLRALTPGAEVLIQQLNLQDQ
jgi:hypothetical protein